jgi:CheY-like chemotaxis protein
VQAWFLDEEMLTMNGSTAIAILRGKYEVKAPMLSITGNAMQEDQSALLRAGASAVLPKPVQLEVLEMQLLRHGLKLGQRRGNVA